jgi:hypothetical protein
MSVSRKRSGFVNDCRAYCYPDCNRISQTLNVFPSISACKNTTHQNCNVSQVNGTIYLGKYNQNVNLFQNYNNWISQFI